jgi:hypothetical protein
MRDLSQSREYARLDAILSAADHALLVAERKARAAGVTEKNLNRVPAIQAPVAVHRAAINAQVEFTYSHDLDFFGDQKKPGTGIFGEIQIIQIPQVERGR